MFYNWGLRFNKKIVYVSTKLLLEKWKKKEKKHYENIYNLWQILGTKQVLLVDFWDHIFKTVFPKYFSFCFLL